MERAHALGLGVKFPRGLLRKKAGWGTGTEQERKEGFAIYSASLSLCWKNRIVRLIVAAGMCLCENFLLWPRHPPEPGPRRPGSSRITVNGRQGATEPSTVLSPWLG